MELSFSNESLLYDLLQEAMAGILVLHAALDRIANEALPATFSMKDSSGHVHTRTEIEGNWGLPKRLTTVLPEITGKTSLEQARPGIWEHLTRLKELRDGVGHVHYDVTYAQYGDDPSKSLYSQLLAVDLMELLHAVEMAIKYYT